VKLFEKYLFGTKQLQMAREAAGEYVQNGAYIFVIRGNLNLQDYK
jgi:hypothetical protein